MWTFQGFWAHIQQVWTEADVSGSGALLLHLVADDKKEVVGIEEDMVLD